MKTLIDVVQSALEQAASVLAELKVNDKRTEMQRDSVEFPFGMVSEFDFNASVRRKTDYRS